MKAKALPGGGVRLTLDPDEVQLLDQWFTQLAELVAPERPESSDPLVALLGNVGNDEAARPPEDEALHRLFPDAYRDDDAAAEEFRRFTEQDLRAGKYDCAVRVLATLRTGDAKGRVALSAQEARDWLRSLNDLRLVLGTRLGIEDEDDAWPAEDDPRAPSLLAYHWLTHVQGALVDAVQRAGH